MSGPGVVALDGVVRRYAWGSTTAIAQLLGDEPDGRPAAELWFGAHPSGPSAVPARASTLEQLVDENPAAVLGAAVVAHYGPHLPFLLKVLAARTALSIQVHPNLEQARAGFAAEQAAGVDPAAGGRNYIDANHKPELICALSVFEALCGFRPVEQTLALLDRLAAPELDFLAESLRGPDPLRSAMWAVLNHADVEPLVTATAGRVAASRDPELRGVQLAAGDFPGDIGVVLALLLNYVRLEPGEASYAGAGTVHAYLRGTGVEIMANSDNVLRCGLTAKHVDVDEVMAVTHFAALADPRWPGVRGSFEVPVPDFRLVRLRVDEPTGLDDPGPLIVLCTSGSVRVGGIAVAAGHAAFVPAAEPTTLNGFGEVFVAGVGHHPERTATAVGVNGALDG